MTRVLGVLLLTFVSVAKANLNNANWRCPTTCPSGEFCVEQANTAIIGAGVAFESTPSPVVTHTNCPTVNNAAAGISGKSIRCTSVNQLTGGLDFFPTVPAPPSDDPVPHYTIAFWMKPHSILNNFRFFNITSQAAGQPRHEIVLYRQNFNLALSVTVGTQRYEGLNGPRIEFTGQPWTHFAIALHTRGGINAVTVYVNGVDSMHVAAPANNVPWFIMRPSVRMSLAKRNPVGSTQGEVGAGPTSVVEYADFVVLRFPPTARMAMDFPLNLFHKRFIPAYPAASSALTGFAWYVREIEHHTCGACPASCTGGCTANADGYTCNGV